MKIDMVLEDIEETGKPRFDAEVSGEQDQKSLAYSAYVLIRMVLELLNSPYRPEFVSLVATLHKAHRDGQLANVEVDNVNSGSGARH